MSSSPVLVNFQGDSLGVAKVAMVRVLPSAGGVYAWTGEAVRPTCDLSRVTLSSAVIFSHALTWAALSKNERDRWPQAQVYVWGCVVIFF